MSKKLYVGNLPFSAGEEQVKNLFAQYGEVHTVNLVTDRFTGKPRGFGFIEMDNAEAAIAQLNEKEFEGRKLRVNEAVERERKPFGSNDRGNGDRRGNNRFNRNRPSQGRGGFRN